VNRFAVVALALLAVLGVVPAWAQAPAAKEGLPERVAALKKSLAQSQGALRTYQWVETTSVSLKGEVKSQKQMSCLWLAILRSVSAIACGAP